MIFYYEILALSRKAAALSGRGDPPVVLGLTLGLQAFLQGQVPCPLCFLLPVHQHMSRGGVAGLSRRWSLSLSCDIEASS